MIIIIARVEFEPGVIDEVQPALDAMMRATWEESGCLSYSMAIENRAEGICTIVERWRSEDDLQSHFATEHMAAFMAATAGKTRGMDARVYTVTDERELAF